MKKPNPKTASSRVRKKNTTLAKKSVLITNPTKSKKSKLLQSLVWKNATAELRKALTGISQMLTNWCSQTIRNHWELGRSLNEISDSRKLGDDRYGPDVLQNIMTFFPIEKPMLHGCLRIARQYSKADIDAFCEARMENDRPLSYSHIQASLRIADRDRRARFLEKTLAKSWTVARLKAAIKAELNAKKNGKEKRGRPPLAPETHDELLAQINKEMGELLKRTARVWNPMALGSAGSPEEHHKTAANVRKAAAKLLKLGDNLTGNTKMRKKRRPKAAKPKVNRNGKKRNRKRTDTTQSQPVT